MDKSIQGKLCTPVFNGRSSTGKTLCKFDLKISNGKIVPCICWAHMLTECSIEEIASAKVDDALVVKGFISEAKKQQGAFGQSYDNGQKEFVVKWFRVNNKPIQRSMREKLVAWAGGEEEYAKERAHSRAYHKRLGNVWAKVTDSSFGWAGESLCICHDGVWKLKIQYLLDILGAKVVNEEIHNFLGKKSLDIREIDRFDCKGYNEKMNELIATAKYFESVP